MTTILHVEDDDALAAMVADSFRALGFKGRFLTVTTIDEASRILDDVVAQPILDLILSDMHLPDGTGLDVIRCVRSNVVRAHVPVVILSGDTAPDTVKRAYALGVNSYIPKGMRGRSITQTMRSLYTYWLEDARLPGVGRAARTHRVLDTAILIRRRRSEKYMEIAERVGPDDGDFWMDLALRDGNLANIFAFLEVQLGDRELPSALLDQIEPAQAETLAVLEALDRHPVVTRADAERYIGMLVAHLHPDLFARVTAELCPASPVAMQAMRQVAADNLDELASWIEAHAQSEAVRSFIAPLRANAHSMRTLLDAPGVG
jgi:two-component system, response regulator